MTRTELIQLLTRYDRELSGSGAQPVRIDRSAKDHAPGDIRDHLLWMIRESQASLREDNAFPTNGTKEKVMRWLGFIQGVLWCKGEYSIDDLRKHNESK